MQAFLRSLLLLALGGPFHTAALNAGQRRNEENPLGKVLQLMDQLTAKLSKAGEEEDKAYAKYVEWCDDASKKTQFDIDTLSHKREKLEAEMADLAASIEKSETKIEDLISNIATDKSDLQDATLIRQKEASDFQGAEAELMDGIDTLGRAITIIDREMSKNPAALAQLDTANLNNALKAFTVVLDAASFSNADKNKLTALVQTQQAADDQELGAPAAAVYKTHSTSILDVLEDMKEKAEEQLSTLRKEETSAKNNYQMLKQSLEDSMAADTKDLEDEKASKAASEETQANTEGDLKGTVQDLQESKGALATYQQDCMQTATDHAASTKGREEELKVIAEAKKILAESTGGAEGQAYSLLQSSSSSTISKFRRRGPAISDKVVKRIQELAKSHHSSALAQLASRISTVLRYGASDGEDIFAKVKSLISDLIAKLEDEAKQDATEKAYCDDQMSKTEAKKVELEDDINKLTSKIDKASADSADLKEEVKGLQADLATLAKQQAEMDKIRETTHAAFLQAKADLEQGLEGVGNALKALRQYYGGSAGASASSAAMVQEEAKQEQPKMPEYHGKAAGAGGSIISILEVVESDFAKELATEEKTEADAESEYQQTTQENKVIRTTKTQDVKYKSQEFIGLDKSISDLTADRETAKTSMAAVMQYYAKIKDRCIAKPESYEEIKKRRAAEIQGLKEALTILEGEAAFLQAGRRSLGQGFLAR